MKLLGDPFLRKVIMPPEVDKVVRGVVFLRVGEHFASQRRALRAKHAQNSSGLQHLEFCDFCAPASWRRCINLLRVRMANDPALRETACASGPGGLWTRRAEAPHRTSSTTHSVAPVSVSPTSMQGVEFIHVFLCFPGRRRWTLENRYQMLDW